MVISINSSHWEGLPRVLLEARPVGVPVVATNVEGADEVVIDQVVGTLCEAGDIERLAAAVIRMLSNQTGSSDGCVASDHDCHGNLTSTRPCGNINSSMSNCSLDIVTESSSRPVTRRDKMPSWLLLPPKPIKHAVRTFP